MEERGDGEDNGRERRQAKREIAAKPGEGVDRMSGNDPDRRRGHRREVKHGTRNCGLLYVK
jgi:hypothetical protein